MSKPLEPNELKALKGQEVRLTPLHNAVDLKMSHKILKDALRSHSEIDTMLYKYDYEIEKGDNIPKQPFPIGAFFASLPIFGFFGLFLYMIVMLFINLW